MYIVNNETNLNKWEADTLDDLMFELDILNVKNKRKGIEENLVVYKTNDNGEILDEVELSIPTEEDIDDIFETFGKEEVEKVEETELNAEEKAEETSLKEDVFNELSEEEREVLNRISTIPNPEADRNKIIEQLNKNKEQEEREQAEQIEREKKEQELLAREKELERRELELRDNEKKQAQREEGLKLQAPIPSNQNQTTVYEGISLKSTDELTDVFKLATQNEVEKLDEQIYILNRQRDKYMKLIRLLDEVNQ